MRNSLIPMVKTVQWHPMLPDIIGGEIAHRYMAITLDGGNFYSRSQKGLRPITAPETFEAILDFYEQAHGSQIKTLLATGFEIIVDFQRQRLTIANDGCSWINSADNTSFTWNMDRSAYFESKASTFFAMHWLKNNSVENQDVFDMAVGDEVELPCTAKCEEPVGNVIDFNQWREKAAKLT